MVEISHNMVFIYEHLKNIFNQELLTIVILFCMIFRQHIVGAITFTIRKILKVEEEHLSRKHTRYLGGYIIAVGITVLIMIWVKEPTIIEKTKKVFKIITILVIAKTIAMTLKPDGVVFRKLQEQETAGRSVLINKFISNVLIIAVYFIAFIIIVSELGYNLNGLIAGMGISTALMALAVQDLVKSIISGATIITEKPFKIGDYIEMGTIGGTVEDITLRNTRIRTPENKIMNIPNLKITMEPVTNLNDMKNRRLLMDLYIGFDTPVEKIQKVISRIKGMLINNSKVVEKTVRVNLKEIVREGIVLEIEAYIAEPKGLTFFRDKEKINIEIIKIMNMEGVNLLYNVQQVKYEKHKTITNEPKQYITGE